MEWILLCAGLLLIVGEFYLPGAILGVAGGISVLSAIFLMFYSYGASLGSFLFLLIAGGMLVLTIKGSIWLIARSGRSGLYVTRDSSSSQATHFDPQAIGKRGRVTADLKPGGYMEIEGVQYAARSEEGYVSAGHQVVVLRGEGDSLIVRKVS